MPNLTPKQIVLATLPKAFSRTENGKTVILNPETGHLIGEGSNPNKAWQDAANAVSASLDALNFEPLPEPTPPTPEQLATDARLKAEAQGNADALDQISAAFGALNDAPKPKFGQIDLRKPVASVPAKVKQARRAANKRARQSRKINRRRAA